MAWLVATLKQPRCARALRAAICGSKYKRAPFTGTERRYGAGGEDGNFVAAFNDGVPRCPSRTT